jgi:hypothetical protein
VADKDAISALRELASFLGYSDVSVPHLSLIHVLEGEAISGNVHARGYATERMARVREEITTRLELARDTGELPASVSVDAAAVLVAAAINGLQTQRLLDPTLDTRPAFDLILDLLIGRADESVPPAFTTD